MHVFSTSDHNGRDQLDSVLAQVRGAAMDGHAVAVEVNKSGGQTIVMLTINNENTEDNADESTDVHS